MNDTAIRVVLPKPQVNFVAYDEIFHALTDVLTQIGACVRAVPTVLDAEEEDLILIVGTVAYYPNLLRDLAAVRARQNRRSPAVFLWLLEHLPDLDTPPHLLLGYLAKSWWDARRRGGDYTNSRGGNYQSIRIGVARGLFDKILVFTPRKMAFLKRHGVDAEYVPSGHHPIWGEDRHGERDIDVLFLGEVLDDRRGRIVKSVQAALAKEGITLKTMYDFNPVGVWGEERNTLLNRTKIYLSLYRFSADASGMRLSLGMGNGALVVSEPVADPSPFIANEHFVESAIVDLPQSVLTYLGDDAARQRICAAATARINASYTLHASVERILALTPLQQERTSHSNSI
jgi:hypothetical protein